MMKINDDQLDEFKGCLAGRVDAAAANEPGARLLEAHVADDGRTCSFVEDCEEADALAARTANSGDLVPEMLETAQIIELHALGDASGERKERLVSFAIGFASRWKGIGKISVSA